MINFLIQTVNGRVEHEFSFHLIKSIEYLNWFRDGKELDYKYVLSEGIDKGYENHIPIGSLEFVFNYLKVYEDIDNEYIYPINIPSELMKDKYLGRRCLLLQKDEIPKETLFVKSNTQYKKFIDVITDSSYLEDDEYVVSELVEFESEWRVFVQHNSLVGIQNYLGDFTGFPDIEAINNMVKDYKNAPLSYTLDVGVLNGNTVVIEVHPLVSCGLYGFSNYKLLPSMFIQGYNFMKNDALNRKNKI